MFLRCVEWVGGMVPSSVLWLPKNWIFVVGNLTFLSFSFADTRPSCSQSVWIVQFARRDMKARCNAYLLHRERATGHFFHFNLFSIFQSKYVHFSLSLNVHEVNVNRREPLSLLFLYLCFTSFVSFACLSHRPARAVCAHTHTQTHPKWQTDERERSKKIVWKLN